MAELFSKVEPKEIQQLGEQDLVRLLHRLLHCEARAFKLKKTQILVPLQTKVADGGRDGRWDAEIGPHEFIPRRKTFYQCKAELVTAAVCENEVVREKKDPNTKKNVLTVQPRVREVLSEGGCYAFFSSHHEIKRKKGVDVDTIVRNRLTKAGFAPAPGACIEFYGCNRIADWVNKFPSAVRFVREVTKGLQGLHYFTVAGWSKLPRSVSTFYRSETVDKKIAAIRESLISGDARMIRFLGLSGVGKTRMLFESLRADEDSPSDLRALSDSTIYVNYGDIRNDLINFVAHLADNNYSALVVIDDCPPDIHERIVQVAGNSELSLLTVFHQPEPPRGDTRFLLLEPREMEEVVEQILRGDAQLVARGEEAVKAVAAFCEGFPQIAILITEFHRAPTLQELRDREPLIRKLIGAGENPDANTIALMHGLALFRSIGGAAKSLDAHLDLIRDLFCQHIPNLEFRKLVQQQLQREVLQQIADTVSVVPRPVAVALAADFVASYPANRWKETVDRLAKGDLLTRFTSRIEELEFSEKATALGKLLLESNIPFDNAEYLITGRTGSRVFRAVCLLNPSVALDKVNGLLLNIPLETLRESKESRRDFVRAFEHAAWEPENFGTAARLLLRLAAAENESWANNATGGFQQLFSLHLSGTKTPALGRLPVIREALGETDPAVRRVAIAALGRGLNFRFFSRTGDETLSGARSARQDWAPSSYGDAIDYWKECYAILRSIVVDDGPDAELAKRILGENFSTLLQYPLLEELDGDFRQLAARLDGLWPEAKDHIKRTLELHDDLSEEHRAALRRWVEYLTPSDEAIDKRLRDVVSRPGWHHHKTADGDYIDLSREEAERLASEVSAKNIDLAPYLSQLLFGDQQQSFSFGVILGKSFPRVQTLVAKAFEIWPQLDPGKRNPSLLSGIMRGLGTGSPLRSQVLDRVAGDDDLKDLLVPLSGSVDVMLEDDFLRIQKAVEGGRVEPFRLRNLIQGQPLRQLSDDFINRQFRQLLQAKPETAQYLFEVLWLHCHGEKGKFERFSVLFSELLLEPDLLVFDGHFGWEWCEAAKLLIEQTSETSWLVALAKYIRDALLQHRGWAGAEFLGKVTDLLFRKAPAETWPIFAEALRTGDAADRFVLMEFLGRTGSLFDNTASPIWRLPETQLRKWIKANRDLIPLILHKMSLYTVEQEGEGGERFQWHPYARTLVVEGETEKELISAIAGNLFSFGSTGSRVPYLQKRLALVQDLEHTDSPKLQRIGRELSDWLNKEIESTRRQEANESAIYR